MFAERATHCAHSLHWSERTREFVEKAYGCLLALGACARNGGRHLGRRRLPPAHAHALRAANCSAWHRRSAPCGKKRRLPWRSRVVIQVWLRHVVGVGASTSLRAMWWCSRRRSNFVVRWCGRSKCQPSLRLCLVGIWLCRFSKRLRWHLFRLLNRCAIACLRGCAGSRRKAAVTSSTICNATQLSSCTTCVNNGGALRRKAASALHRMHRFMADSLIVASAHRGVPQRGRERKPDSAPSVTPRPPLPLL